MKISDKQAYGYKDITIVPEVSSDIFSRSLVNPYDGSGMLPIFAAPMDTVIDKDNWKEFISNNIYPVIPRSVPYDDRIDILLDTGYKSSYAFVAFSMNEAGNTFLKEYESNLYLDLKSRLIKSKKGSKMCPLRICIDVANGHMSNLIRLIKDIKKEYGNHIEIMSGNIANPKTYRLYDEAGCDYVRVSIGSGEGCSTTTKTGIHYPIFSLLEETYKEKQNISGKCAIIADGGIREMGDIQKALIYADYVMIGGLFSQMYEASGQIYTDKVYKKKFPREIENKLLTYLKHNKPVDKDKKHTREKWESGNISYYRLFKGMSTKEAQEIINKSNGDGLERPIKESEGFVKRLPVLYSLKEWAIEEKAALSSAMSYTFSLDLESYKDSKWVVNAQRNYN